MNDTANIDPTVRLGTVEEVEADFNRTIEIPSLATGTVDVHRTATLETAENDDDYSGEALEDLVSGVDINPYINLNLDASAHLESSLEPVDGKYTILSEFAQGGTAKLSIARDRNLRRLVAVKSLRMDAENISELLNAFVTEAKVTAQLDHPGIIPIYGLARDAQDGIHLIMKLVNGRTLREYLQNITMNYRIRGIGAFDEDMQLRKRLEIFLRVCDTLLYAHHRGVIHRDLKPENIMIGKYMEVYVMDWGLSVVIPEDGIPPDVKKISGTPRYFAPEVLRGEPLDFRSDIFTLGLILQEIVTLQYAVTGNSEKELIRHNLKAQIEPVEHLFKHKIGRDLRAVIRKATAPRLEDRYQTVDALAEDIRRYMAGVPVSAKMENFIDRGLRYVFEHILKF